MIVIVARIELRDVPLQWSHLKHYMYAMSCHALIWEDRGEKLKNTKIACYTKCYTIICKVNKNLAL